MTTLPQIIALALLTSCEAQYINSEKVQYLVKKWSPLVWLAPGEKHLPSAVEDFLIHVNIVNAQENRIAKPAPLETVQNSQNYNLVTKQVLAKLLNNTGSVLYGDSPKVKQIPVYVIVTHCTPYISFRSSDSNAILNDINIAFGRAEPTLFFYVNYWLFYPYNEGKEFCFVGKVPAPIIFDKCYGHYKKLGNHVGDWEHMSLSFMGKSFPSKLYLAVHDVGVYYKYDMNRNFFRYESQIPRIGVVQPSKFPPIVRIQGGHPVLFSAAGSHGLWSSPGEHTFMRIPKILDKTGYGIPWKTWTNLKIFNLGLTELPGWMLFKGRWGNPKNSCILFKKLGFCEYTDGPLGPLRDKLDFYC